MRQLPKWSLKYCVVIERNRVAGGLISPTLKSSFRCMTAALPELRLLAEKRSTCQWDVLGCGVLDWGFARVRFLECRHEICFPFALAHASSSPLSVIRAMTRVMCILIRHFRRNDRRTLLL